jgi:hypothetical protein
LSFSSDLPTTSFTGATVETSIADSDLVLIYDDSATAVRKMTKANLVAGIGASAGQVIQVVSATDSTQRSTTSTSYVTASNTLSVTITPSATANKIFLLCTTVSYGLTSTRVLFTIFRGATNLGAGTASAFAENRPDWNSVAFSYLDSPSTTSATTYQVYFKSDSGGLAYLNNDTTASLTAFEIKG